MLFLLVLTLCKKFNRARDGLRESGEVFERLTKSADPKDIEEWTRQAEQAEKDRLNNVEAMDIYNAKTHTRECSFRKCI
jgi:hypothetical protein